MPPLELRTFLFNKLSPMSPDKSVTYVPGLDLLWTAPYGRGSSKR